MFEKVEDFAKKVAEKAKNVEEIASKLVEAKNEAVKAFDAKCRATVESIKASQLHAHAEANVASLQAEYDTALAEFNAPAPASTPAPTTESA